jgi:hypothetical protein
LLLCGALLLAVATAAKERAVDGVVLLTAVASVGISVVSFVYFCPIPAVLTGAAAVLALVARSRPMSQP